MAWETFQSNDGIYLVNWEGLSRIIRCAVRSQAMLAFSEKKIEKHFIGPDFHSVEVDWAKVRETTTLESERILRHFYYGARHDPGYRCLGRRRARHRRRWIQRCLQRSSCFRQSRVWVCFRTSA